MKLPLLFALAGLMAISGQAAEAKSAAAAVALHTARLATGVRDVSVTLAVFAEQDFRIRVIDNPGEYKNGKYSTLSAAMNATGCVAGCNGSYFEQIPFAPVGLMISEGVRIGRCNQDTWMKALLVIRGNRPALESSASFQDSPDITDAVQAGPWLVRKGVAESDNNKQRVARRTFICRDLHGQWALGVSDPCSLQELSLLLKSPEITAILDIQEAMNFDGGPSTGLWCKQEAGSFYQQERWTVRNYIGISPRSAP
jgi:exopolysaccharide biosynthesis protein